MRQHSVACVSTRSHNSALARSTGGTAVSGRSPTSPKYHSPRSKSGRCRETAREYSRNAPVCDACNQANPNGHWWRIEESPPYGDTAGAPLFDTNADGEITHGDEADTVYTAQVITDCVILVIFSGPVTAPLKIIFEIVFHAWPFPVGYY
jgi:hypothetical protein